MPLLDIRGLKTHFKTDDGWLHAVDGVDIAIDAGETVCVVGESGCGKSVTALSVMRLVPDPPGRIVGGEIRLEDVDLLALDDDAMERESVLRSIAIRRGQPAFRDAILRQYEGRCVFSGWDVVSSLEAAHVVPYANNGSSKVTNGLLLRGDLHTLFDLHLITVDPDSRTVVVAQELQMTKAAELHGRPLAWPLDAKAAPPREVLARHHALAMAKSNRATPNASPRSWPGGFPSAKSGQKSPGTWADP